MAQGGIDSLSRNPADISLAEYMLHRALIWGSEVDPACFVWVKTNVLQAMAGIISVDGGGPGRLQLPSTSGRAESPEDGEEVHQEASGGMPGTSTGLKTVGCVTVAKCAFASGSFDNLTAVLISHGVLNTTRLIQSFRETAKGLDSSKVTFTLDSAIEVCDQHHILWRIVDSGVEFWI